RIADLKKGELLTDIGDALPLFAAEEGAVAHMNEDHRDAIALYATRLLDDDPGDWRVVSLDPEGCDLALGERVRRLEFPERVTDAGIRNGAFGADKFGFAGLKAVHWNLTEPALYEHALHSKEAELAYGGALAAQTGVHTGRSPKDKFIVRDTLTDKTVWWDNN